ncbi:class I histocompatibility antigen, F10 alpha chain-like isoform X2 [Scleropages formosus]|uniref:class I histocompatibility antigen, F10 alpha chain-like isoform X2 n=1 Tax=Scleropages formosus TaxID=113540 RepID=UPI0008788C52|nr:class I histocompatibility antigen, F10 alpha chain-like isoform X2 [Scleropages formosus]
MWFQLLSLLLLPLWTEGSDEIHSLEYIYTALSKPIGLPGIYEFTAMGILNDKEIDYYNSQEKLKIPRQEWMKERLDENYWGKGTQSRRSKEQWFKVNVNILMDRMRHNSSDIHVLQWRHGCKGVQQPDGSLKFKEGFDQYSYDGEDFLSFDESNSRWIAPVPAAQPTKKKWDDSQTLNQYTKGYLQKECMDWLSKFMYYGEVDLRKHSPPKVFVFAKKSKNPGNMVLHCLATEFYPKDVVVEIYRNGIALTERDGVLSTGVRPTGVRPDRENPDERPEETFQLKKSLEIPENDDREYSCKINHRALKEPVHKTWDRTCCDCKDNKIGIIVGVLLVILLAAVGGIVFFLYKQGIIVKNKAQGSKDSDSGHGSSDSSSSENLNGGRQSLNGSDSSSNNFEEENPLMNVKGSTDSGKSSVQNEKC